MSLYYDPSPEPTWLGRIIEFVWRATVLAVGVVVALSIHR